MLLSGAGSRTRSREPVAGTRTGAESKLNRLHNTVSRMKEYACILALGLSDTLKALFLLATQSQGVELLEKHNFSSSPPVKLNITTIPWRWEPIAPLTIYLAKF